MNEYTYGAVRRILNRNGKGLLFVKRLGRPVSAPIFETDPETSHERRIATIREFRFSSAVDTSLPCIGGMPGSSERIEALASFYASQILPQHASDDIADDTGAELSAFMFGAEV